MEVDTGNIVAMASMPDYDTNVWTAEKMDTEVWKKIMGNYQNGTITPYSSGMSGHEFGSTVLLGSTIKPLSVLVGLNEGLFTTSTIYTDRGIAHFGKNDKSSVRNSSGHVYGSMDPARAIEKSSNAFMVDMVGKKLWEKYHSEGINIWDKYMKEFGLGVSTKSGLPNEYLGQINYTDTKAAGECPGCAGVCFLRTARTLYSAAARPIRNDTGERRSTDQASAGEQNHRCQGQRG